MNRLARTGAAATALALVLHAAPAFAQAGGLPPGGMPKPEDIQKAAHDMLAASPSATTELPGLAKITYKSIPSSAESMQKTLGDKYKDQLPKGIDIDAILKQYGPQVQEGFNKYLAEPDGWKFEALADLKWKSNKIPKGEYKLSLEVESESLKQIILTQGTPGEKGAVRIAVRFDSGKKAKDEFEKLKFELKAVEPKKGDKDRKFDLNVEFFRAAQKTTEPFKGPPADDKDKKDDKKDSPPAGGSGGGSSGNGGSSGAPGGSSGGK